MANIYDQASLVMIPSGTKTSKIFSQKPVNGDGDFTFSRSTAATRVNADGNIEKERTNFVKYSQDYSQWNTFGGTTLTTGITDPNGGSNAATISGIGTGTYTDGAYMLSNPVTINAGSVVNQSIYLKGSGTIAIGIERAITGAYFFYSKNVTLTSEWQRFDNFQQIPTSATGFNFYVTNASGTTASSVDIAFAQFEFGTAPTEYIPTNGSAVTTGITDNVPRLDYTDSSCPALLLEPQRTNLLTQSEYFGAWTNYQSSTNSTNEISPEGLQNAFEIIESNTLDAHTIRYQYTFQSGQTYTITAFLKAKTRTKALLAFGGATLGGMSFEERSSIFDLSNGTITREVTGGNSTITDFGNGWYRCSVTITPLSTSSANFDIYIADDNGDNVYQGNGSSGIYIYGAQLEAGSYATSYIPTYGTSVTRNEETCEVTSAEDLIGQTEGTIAGEFTFKSGETTNRLFSISGADWNSIGHIRFDMINLRPQAKIRSAVADIASVLGTEDIAIGSLVKFAVVYTSTTLKMFVNGAQIGSTETLSGSLPSLMNEIVVDALGGAFNSNTQNNQLNPYKQALVFKTALTDQEAIDLTTI